MTLHSRNCDTYNFTSSFCLILSVVLHIADIEPVTEQRPIVETNTKELNCNADLSNGYYGNQGALNCLREVGDVAVLEGQFLRRTWSLPFFSISFDEISTMISIVLINLFFCCPFERRYRTSRISSNRSKRLSYHLCEWLVGHIHWL